MLNKDYLRSQRPDNFGSRALERNSIFIRKAMFNPYVHKLDKQVRTHGRLNAQTEYRVRTHSKSVKMSFIHFTGVLYGQFFFSYLKMCIHYFTTVVLNN